MPYEIGKPVFDKILSAPRPDFEKMKAEAEEVERELHRAKMEKKPVKHENKLQSNQFLCDRLGVVA